MRPHSVIVLRLWFLLVVRGVSCMSLFKYPQTTQVRHYTAPCQSHMVHKRFNIVVAGGNSFNATWFSELSDVELFNPFWRPYVCEKSKNLPIKLDKAISGNVENQPVVCGGLKSQSSYNNGLEQKVVSDCYTLKNFTWHNSKSSLRCPRWGASSVMLNNREMWVLGGNPKSSKECVGIATSSEVWNTKNEKFEFSATLPEPMVYHCTVKIDADHIFVVNGYDWSHRGVSHAYVVDTSTRPFTFSKLPSLRKSRSQAACGIITYSSTMDNQTNLAIAVAGGGFKKTSTTTEIYRLTKSTSHTYNTQNIWEPGPILPRGFVNGCQINSEVNQFILIGGFDEFGNVKSDLLHYDINSETFETLPATLNIPRYGCTSFQIENN